MLATQFTKMVRFMAVKAILAGGLVMGLFTLSAIPLLTEESAASGYTVNVGDCFNDPLALPSTGETDVGDVPCHLPHDNEVYAQTELPLEDYPGQDALFDQAEEFCFEAFEGYVGTPYEDSILGVSYYFPTRQSWTQSNDREVACAVFDFELRKLVGSVKGSAV